MPNIKPFLLFILYLICFDGNGQDNFNTLGESMLSLTHKISKKYSVNFAFRSRYFLHEDDKFQYQQQQVDLYHFSKFKINNNQNFSLGVYFRNRDYYETGSNELRFTQQFSSNKQNPILRYRHRFRTEQRILDTKTIFRQRYRFAIDFPLNGKKQNIKKPYLICTAESLLSFSKPDKPETDIRVSTQIGWKISPILRLQTGLEHRLEAFNLKAKNNLFVLTSALLKI